MVIEFLNKYQPNTPTFVLLNSNKLTPQTKEIFNKNIQAKLSESLKFEFRGKQGQFISSIVSHTDKSSNLIYLVGIGGKTSLKSLKNIGQKIASTASSKKYSKISLVTDILKSPENLASFFTGICHGNYHFDKYITTKKPKKIQEINIIDQRSSQINFKEIFAETLKVGNSLNYVKDLVNSPAIEITPSILAVEAKKIAKKSKKIKFSELGEKELKKHGLNLIVAVGQGSAQESKLIMLEYKNNAKNQKPLMIVGKGVTFDAGGLNLKPTNNIETMKTDMAGAATVLGLFNLLTEIDLDIHLIGIIPSVENLVGDKAYKPGDILTAYNGKTIEITNTDAEGRLILADAISYGIKKYNPESIIDIATLTGACIVALGYTHTGLFGNNKKLLKQIKAASLKSGEKVWRLPIDKFHSEKVAGTISDYKNWTGGVLAGSVMAAAFLQKFVKKTPWIHLDIAGTSFIDMQIEHKSKGATGEPLNLLYEFIKKYSL